MFGLSFSKILFTVLVIVAVWRGFKWIEIARQRAQVATAAKHARRKSAGPRPQGARPDHPRPRPAVDLVPCRICGAYVPNGTFCRDEEHCLLKDEKERPHVA